jgi:hypothetical protein
MENNAKAAAIRNLTNKLGRKPLATEIAGLVKTRKQKKNEDAYFRNVMARAAVKEAGKEALKAAKKAASEEVKGKQKAEKEKEKAIKKAEKAEERVFQKAIKLQDKAIRKAEKSNNSSATRRTLKAVKEYNAATRKAARADTKAAKLNAKARAKVQFAEAETKARENLTRTLGKAPQMANIKRLAGIRTSGINLSTNDYMRVKKYKNTLKKRNGKMNMSNFPTPNADVCAQCELKKFLEHES